MTHASGRRLIGVTLCEHLGDVVASEPVARFVRAAHPGAHVAWLTARPHLRLARAFEGVDSVHELPCLVAWERIRGSGTFDVEVNLHLSGRGCSQCGIQVHKRDDGAGISTANFLSVGPLLSVFAMSAGLPPLTDAPRLNPGEAARDAVEALGLPRRFVVIHCTPNDPRKEWTALGWATLIRRITDELRVPVFEVGSVATQSSAISLCGRLSILETAEVIRRASLFVGIDSGPAHLANAVGTPGVVLLGRLLHFERYCPFTGGYGLEGGLADLIYSNDAAALIDAGTVFAAAAARIAG
ncbi:MAG TPA: glycosyltransferase family 9 protein [Humisphaera sp.]